MHETPYTAGETRALIAPFMGVDPEKINNIVIVADSTEYGGIGVFTTYGCQIIAHGNTQAICLLTQAITSLATRIYEDSPQHGPGE